MLLLAGSGLDLVVSRYRWFPERPIACVARLVTMDWELGSGLRGMKRGSSEQI